MNDDRWNSYGNTSGNGQYRDDNTSSKDQAYQEYLRLRENRSSRSSDRSRHIKDDSLYGEYYAGNSRKKRSSGGQYVDGTYYYERSGRHRQADTGQSEMDQRRQYEAIRRQAKHEYMNEQPYRSGSSIDDTPYGSSEMRKRSRAESERGRKELQERYLSERERVNSGGTIARPGRTNRDDRDRPGEENDAANAPNGRKGGKNGGGGKKKRRGLKIALIVVLILVLGIGGVIAAGLTAIKSTLDNVGRVELDPDAIGIDPQVDAELSNYRNIAILGVDARDMSSDEDVRSDAIVIASINKETNEIKLFSVYRDTMLDMGDDIGLDKITHAYAYGGPSQVLYVLNKNLDLNIKEVVVVNWKSVADTVDALGGLDIEIQESEIDEMNKYIEDTYNTIGGSNEKISSPGMQTLNGNQAVTYARIRKDAATGDFRRNERMKIVVKATFEKAKTMKISSLKKISKEILPEIKTNMSSADMMGMVLKLTSYEMTDSVGWPYDHDDWDSDVYYNIPVTLDSNVTQLHEDFFAQDGYEPTQDVLDISEWISAVTGYYGYYYY